MLPVYRRTCVGEAQRPQPQVGGRVGDAAQAVLYSVDALVQELISKVNLSPQTNTIRPVTQEPHKIRPMQIQSKSFEEPSGLKLLAH